jgi:MFS family permease
LAALAVFGLSSKFAWDPVNVAWMADIVANDREKSLGLVVALSSIVAMTASVISPVVNGWIRDQTGSLQGAFFLGAALAFAGAALSAQAAPAATAAEQRQEANA